MMGIRTTSFRWAGTTDDEVMYRSWFQDNADDHIVVVAVGARAGHQINAPGAKTDLGYHPFHKIKKPTKTLRNTCLLLDRPSVQYNHITTTY